MHCINVSIVLSIGDWFRTRVGVRQGCLLSPILFNVFLERITTDTLEDHEGTVSIGGRTITDLRFADDIDGLAGEEEELAKIVECLNKAFSAYSMEISAKKTKLKTDNQMLRGLYGNPFGTHSLEKGHIHGGIEVKLLLLFFFFFYSLTTRVAGAPQMISQPVSSTFPCSPLPSWTWRTPDLSIP